MTLFPIQPPDWVWGVAILTAVAGIALCTSKKVCERRGVALLCFAILLFAIDNLTVAFVIHEMRRMSATVLLVRGVVAWAVVIALFASGVMQLYASLKTHKEG